MLPIFIVSMCGPFLNISTVTSLCGKWNADLIHPVAVCFHLAFSVKQIRYTRKLLLKYQGSRKVESLLRWVFIGCWWCIGTFQSSVLDSIHCVGLLLASFSWIFQNCVAFKNPGGKQIRRHVLLLQKQTAHNRSTSLTETQIYDRAVWDACREKKKEKDREELWKRLDRLELNNKNKKINTGSSHS